MDSREPHAARIRQRMLLQTEIRNAILDDLILSGEIPTGEKLPSEAELCETYAASRVTVRSALQSLAEQGFIQTRRGSGSIVLPRAKTIASHLTRLVSFDTYADQAGESFETVDLIIEDCPDDDARRDAFPAHQRENLARVSRAKARHGQRVAWIIDYVPDEVLGRELLVREFGRTGSVLDILIERDLAQFADCRLEPVLVTTALAQHVDAAPGSPALQMNELTCNRDGDLVDRSESWMLPGAFEFSFRRNRDSL